MPVIRAATCILCAAVLGLAASAASLCAEDIKPAAGGETIRGTLVNRTGTALIVRAEGEHQTRRFVVAGPQINNDPKTTAFLRDLVVGSEIRVQLTPGPRGHVTSVFLLAGPGKFGLLAGKVTSTTSTPGNMPGIDIKDDLGHAEHYSPQWTAGGFDAEMLEAIARRHVGDRVEVRWAEDDHRRVSTMRVLALSPEAVAEHGDEGGTLIGRVVEKDKDSLVIQADGGDKLRYLPQRVVGTKGELDRDVLRAMAATKIGTRVEAGWMRDGQRRLFSLKPAGDRRLE